MALAYTAQPALNVKAFKAVKHLSNKARSLPVLNRTAFVDTGRTVVAVSDLRTVAYLPMVGEGIEPDGEWEAIALPECEGMRWSYAFGRGDCPVLPPIVEGADVVAELSPADCALLGHVAAACDHGDPPHKPVLAYVCLTGTADGRIEAAGADGFRLHVARLGTSLLEPGQRVTIHAGAALALAKLKCWARLALVDDARPGHRPAPLAQFECLATSRGGRVAVILTRPDDGPFPDLAQIIPHRTEHARTEPAGDVADLYKLLDADRKADARLPDGGRGEYHRDFLYPVSVPGAAAYSRTDFMAAAVAPLASGEPVTTQASDRDGGPILVTARDGDWRAVVMPMNVTDRR